MLQIALTAEPATPFAGARTQRAYEHVREAILRGELAAGEIVVDAEIAEALGVSKTPVRQALKLLEQEGLLERGRRRQLVVRAVSTDQREEIVEVREALGTIAVRRACRVMSSDEIDLLRLSLLRQKRAAQAGDEETFIELDEDFHLILTQAAEVPIVLRFLKQIRGFVRLMRLKSPRRADYMLDVVAEHEAIVDAIEARDEDAAVAAFSQHIRTSEYPEK
jgi:GntR family transcriptional regulator, rspAB operon transcriptional repressor